MLVIIVASGLEKWEWHATQGWENVCLDNDCIWDGVFGLRLKPFAFWFAVDFDLDDRYRACYVGNRNRDATMSKSPCNIYSLTPLSHEVDAGIWFATGCIGRQRSSEPE